MRIYWHITPDGRIELRIYPNEQEIEQGMSLRMTKSDAQSLKLQIEEAIEQLEE